MGFGFGGELPGKVGTAQRLEETQRHPHIGMVRLAARLEQQHAHGGIGTKPVGEYRTGRTGTDHDEIEFQGVHGHKPFC